MESPITPKGAILQALIRGESYALKLIDRVGELTGGEIKLHQGSVYPALKALEKAGMVTSYRGEPLPERGGRPRIYYRLTGAGSEVAMNHRRAMVALAGVQGEPCHAS